MPQVKGLTPVFTEPRPHKFLGYLAGAISWEGPVLRLASHTSIAAYYTTPADPLTSSATRIVNLQFHVSLNAGREADQFFTTDASLADLERTRHFQHGSEDARAPEEWRINSRYPHD